MESYRSSFADKAFGDDADKNLMVTYQAHWEAHSYVSSALEKANGIAILQGPRGAGKTSFINELTPRLQQEVPVAVFDGAKSSSQPHVSNLLSKFGVDAAAEADDQLLQKLSAYVTEKAAMGTAPIVVVDNVDQLELGALSLLNWLADLDVRGRWAIRFLFAGAGDLDELIGNYSMRHFERRHPVVFRMKPLSKRETVIYLRTKYVAAGGENADAVLSLDVCDELHEKSGGWPGRLDDLALQVVSRIGDNTDTATVPHIIVSLEDQPLAEHVLTKSATIIGRDQTADIVIDDNYVSKQHAILQLNEAGVALLDLNSTNGTRVNSTETSYSILRNGDVISIGQYRLKVDGLPAVSDGMEETIMRADTLTLENPEDIRRSRVKRIIQRSRMGKKRPDSQRRSAAYQSETL